MAALYDWETIRAEDEAGASQNDLARRHGVSRKAIQSCGPACHADYMKRGYRRGKGDERKDSSRVLAG